MLEAQVTQEERPACERPPPRFLLSLQKTWIRKGEFFIEVGCH